MHWSTMGALSDENLPKIVSSHNVSVTRRGRVMLTNETLAARLLERLERGECEIVRHATEADLVGFKAERSKCHENVNRWCAQNSRHKPVRGWIVTSTLFDKHSVIDRGAEGLLDITPINDRPHTMFLRHDGTQEEFDAFPHQVIALPN